DPELELRLQNIIHVSRSFEYVRPVIPGDVLRVILTINKLQIRGEAEFITLNGVVTAADDSLVATFISVVLHRRYTVSSPNSVTQPARSARTELANPKLPSKTIALTRELLSRYAVVSGDSNPIHLDDTAARALGLSGVLAHGMWTMGAAAKVVLDWLGGDVPRLKSYRTRFAAPLYVPVSGVNVEVNAEVSGNSADTTTVSLEVSCGGVKILNGTQIEVHNV
ncbi:MAG: MaoC family dehydratase N-terminal domain-containing protein, partial [Propionibacteriaceae bacterium]|nr:MaoC family dehydratase N-terminal domain-containing protein [Propionibacteriaceae bacterium]